MKALALNISNTPVRQDSEGRYNLNDLHKASGGEGKNKPSNWQRTQQAIELIGLLESEQSIGVIPPIVTKQGLGTFAVKDLVYAYAMWISPAFTLKVIHAYDSLVSVQYGLKQLPEPKTKKALPGGLTAYQQDTVKALVKSRAEELPKEKQAGATIRIWSAVKRKFGVSYKEIAPENYVNVISLIGRLPLEGELLPKEVQLPTDTITISLNQGMHMMNVIFTGKADNPQRYSVAVTEKYVSIQQMDNKLMADVLKDQGYIVAKKDELNIGNMVLEHIPYRLLPIMIETAGRRLNAIEAGKLQA
ncbi:MAG: KilA-N domain-containing protein [Methylobacter sp.]